MLCDVNRFPSPLILNASNAPSGVDVNRFRVLPVAWRDILTAHRGFRLWGGDGGVEVCENFKRRGGTEDTKSG